MSGFLSGMIFGSLLTFAFATMPGSKISNYDTAKQACEKSLPRDEQCVIIAIPISKD